MPALTLSPAIKFDGALLPTSWQDALLECKVELEMRTTGQVILRFLDAGYVLTSSSTVKLGTAVVVSIPGGNTLITAEVTSVGVEQSEGEQPELVVTALDKSHRMARGTNVKTYVNVSYSDIVSQLVSAAALSASADSTSVTFDYVLQVDSDLAFLSEMAARTGYDWWVEDTTLNFKKPASGSDVELALSTDLTTFSVRASGHPPGSVSVYGWDRDNQQQLNGSTSAATLKATSTLADSVSDGDTAFGSAILVNAALAGSTQEEVTQLSQALFDWAAANSIRASGLTTGNDSIKLGNSVKISDAGPLTGTYPITRVEHTYRPRRGFLTRFWSGGRGTHGGPGLNGSAGQRGPLLGAATHHPGVVVGTVTNINDPNKTGRVKVLFPGLDQSQESAWGRILAPGGGASRGNVNIPEVVDEVLVAFEGGDPRQPVILGGLFGSKSTIPKWTVQDGKVSARRFTSRLGHIYEFGDGTEAADQYFMVQLAGGNNTLKISQQSTILQIPSGQPLTIQAGSSKIAFSDTGDITIQGPNITIQAQQNLKLSGLQVNVSADSALKMQGGTQASLQGAVLELQGDAQASLKGGIVQIN
jgi:uncharacterized protein involved in type VI secretion and phage assembly